MELAGASIFYPAKMTTIMVFATTWREDPVVALKVTALTRIVMECAIALLIIAARSKPNAPSFEDQQIVVQISITMAIVTGLSRNPALMVKREIPSRALAALMQISMAYAILLSLRKRLTFSRSEFFG